MASLAFNAQSNRQLPAIPWHTILWATWIVAGLLGLVGLWQLLTEGHVLAGYGSYVPWGLWVALYFHGVGIAGGVFVIGVLGFILEWPGFQGTARLRTVITLSFAAMIPAFLGIMLELGHKERALSIFFSSSFTSMMAFNAWMYTIFGIIAAACWFLSLRPDSSWLKPLLALGILFSILFPSQSGSFFGVVEAKDFWHGGLLPMLFLASAATAGSATLLVVRGIQAGRNLESDEEDSALARLRLFTIIGLVIYFAFEFSEFSIHLWNPEGGAPAVELVLFGPYWWMFWFIHLLAGGLVPLVLLAMQRRIAWVAGALLVAVMFVSSRLKVLIPGQSVGEIEGLQEAFQHTKLSYVYSATTMEYLVACLLLAVGLTVFFIGRRLDSKMNPSE